MRLYFCNRKIVEINQNLEIKSKIDCHTYFVFTSSIIHKV